MINTFIASVLSDEKTGEGSTKRVAYMLVVVALVASLLVLSGIFIGLYISLPADISVLKEFRGLFENITMVVVGAVTTGYIGGKMVEKKTSKGSEIEVAVESAPTRPRRTRGLSE